jgi:hypothetical protein
MSDSITLSAWFEPEEIALMRGCLEAIVSRRFFDDALLHTLTGRSHETFYNLLDRFDSLTSTTGSTTQEDCEIILQAILQLCGYPIADPIELESLSGIPRLYLGWFHYKLRSISNEWKQYVEDDADQVRWASLSRS